MHEAVNEGPLLLMELTQADRVAKGQATNRGVPSVTTPAVQARPLQQAVTHPQPTRAAPGPLLTPHYPPDAGSTRDISLCRTPGNAVTAMRPNM